MTERASRAGTALSDMLHTTMNYEEVPALPDQGAQLVDVRSPQEHRKHPCPGAVTIPLPVIQEALKQLDKTTTVLLYCASGHRNGTARRVPEACGLVRVHNPGSHSFLQDCYQ
jgi:rhodanese-related sulfurtransferase